MESIIVAIIGGLFSLAGIWLKHALEAKGKQTSSTAPYPRSGRRSRSVEDAAAGTGLPGAVGNARIFGGLILLGIVLVIFLVLNAEAETIDVSDAAGWILLFLGGACLVYGSYLLIAGIGAKIKG